MNKKAEKENDRNFSTFKFHRRVGVTCIICSNYPIAYLSIYYLGTNKRYIDHKLPINMPSSKCKSDLRQFALLQSRG